MQKVFYRDNNLEKQCNFHFSVNQPIAKLEAQRLNRAVLSYDFIYLLIAVAATLLFVFETLYRVYNLYNSTNKRKKRQVHDPMEEEYQRVMRNLASFHESL